jgi:hypothetical protein
VSAVPSDPRYFFIIGAMKAGTTSLYKYLAAHPQLYPSPRKEPRVFRDPVDPAQTRAAFLELFEGRNDEAWCFEGSTAYTKYPGFSGVPQRLKSIVPDARFVYLVRNPVERTWSQYVHNLAHGRETRPFHQAIGEDPQYLDISRYHLQLKQYVDVFPRDRILVQVFEDMVADPLATVRAVCEFLGVDTAYLPPDQNAYNRSSSKRAASRPLRLLQAAGAAELMPWRVRHWLRAAGSPLPDGRAVLSPAVRGTVAAALRDDTEAFFDVFGRRVTSWRDFA